MDHDNNFNSDNRNSFQALFEDAPLAYQSLGNQGQILLVNNEWLRLLGYERDEVVGRSIAEFLTDQGRETLADRFPTLLAGGQVRNQDFEMIANSGDVIPVQIDGRAVMGDDNVFLRTHCIVRDVSAEVAAGRARDKSEGRYRRLVELAREGIWEIDAAAHTVYVNPAMAAMLGYAESEMVGKHLFDFMDERGRLLSERNLARREHGIGEQHDFEFITKQGRRIITTLETSPLYDDEGHYSGALAGVIDVTERRRFEQEMLHTQKLESLGVLAGGIAHDFNNLLQSIVGNADLALDEDHVKPPVVESLREIRHAAGRATDLCQQMLAYAGRGSFRVESVDVAELVQEMSEILKVSVSKMATFEIDVAPGLPRVEADSSQLGQVVMNLITNAAESLGEREGSVRVAVLPMDLAADDIRRQFPLGDLQPGLHVVLKVTDTGCGMNEDTRLNIFDPFFTTKFAGRGLGLASVLGIIKRHGGAIAVDSVLNEGTSVTVALPAQVTAPTDHDSLGPQTAEAPFRPLRILAAEDELSLQHLVRRLMVRLGHEVHVVQNGREAVAFYEDRSSEIDLVLLDLTMPVMDGKEAMKAIRARDRDVPIIISSGFPAEDLAGGFGSDQPSLFLQKPYEVAQLQAALSQCAT